MKLITNVVSKCMLIWQVKPVLIFMLLLGFLFIGACSKDDANTEEENISDVRDLVLTDNTTDPLLTTFMGELGIVLDARPYFKKGQPIAKLRITGTNSNIFEPVIIEVDQISNYAVFKLSNTDLSDADKTRLIEGIDLEISLLNENENELFSEILENSLFKTDNSKLLLRGDDVPDSNTIVDLNPNTPYFLQLTTSNGAFETKALDTKLDLVYGGSDVTSLGQCGQLTPAKRVRPSLNAVADFADDNLTQQFYFQQHDESNVFSIISLASGTYLQMNPLFPGIPLTELITSTISKSPNYSALPDAFKFRIKKENNVYKLFSYNSSTPLEFREFAGSCDFFLTETLFYKATTMYDSLDAEGQNFRIVASGIIYKAEDIRQIYGQPILPPAQNLFKFNSTLKNCTSRDISQKVGTSLSESTKMSLSWEEKIGFTAGAKSTTEVSVKIEANASFFGAGAKVSGTVTQGLELSTSYSESSSISEGETTTDTQTIFSERTITVSPRKQIEAYDAVQKYDDIKVPFVQELKITARTLDNAILTCKEIATQTNFGGFEGTITEIGDSFIKITIRGVAQFDQALKGTSEAFESDAVCN